MVNGYVIKERKAMPSDDSGLQPSICVLKTDIMEDSKAICLRPSFPLKTRESMHVQSKERLFQKFGDSSGEHKHDV